MGVGVGGGGGRRAWRACAHTLAPYAGLPARAATPSHHPSIHSISICVGSDRSERKFGLFVLRHQKGSSDELCLY